LIAQSRFRCRPAQVSLFAQFLQAHSKGFTLLFKILLRGFFDKLVDQHRIRRVVADSVRRAADWLFSTEQWQCDKRNETADTISVIMPGAFSSASRVQSAAQSAVPLGWNIRPELSK
jgi:hypothetical protein